MNDLRQLPNIGKVVAEQLEIVGISTPAQLKSVGSEEAFTRLATLDESACINMLYALEGAIQGIRWHNLSSERKKELLEFFYFCKKQTKQYESNATTGKD
jgi:DNA transformation protein and related proteins